MELPNFLVDKLTKQYGEELFQKIEEGYLKERVVSFRVNTLKATIEEIEEELMQKGVEFETVKWSKEAFIIKNAKEEEIKKMQIYENGKIYLQSLSSMLPPIMMEPKENTDILDMTAAPGGKTTQIAAFTRNKARITACEMNGIRLERLKYNIEKQGASVMVMQEDSRKLSDYFSFDQILLDAPCSGSGTIRLLDKKSYQDFSEKLVQKSAQTQLILLKKALNILKAGHEMVYSTCSILVEENEEILEKALKGVKAEIVPIEIEGIKEIPQLLTKIKGTLCICPNAYYDGFFIAKIKKN